MRLIINKNAKRKLWYFARGVVGEISGMGKLKRDGDVFTLLDVVIFHQQCTGATTTLDDTSQAVFINDLMKSGEDLKSWGCWWHSHADMDTFFSSTDTGTIDEHSGEKYLLALVINKKGEAEARFDTWVYSDILDNKIHYEEEDIDIEYEDDDIDDGMKKACMDEILEKVSIPAISEAKNGLVKDLKSNQDDMLMRDYYVDAEDFAYEQGRTFNQAGYDTDGYDIDGMDEKGDYHEEYDAVASCSIYNGEAIGGGRYDY